MKEKKTKSGMSRIFELSSDHKGLLVVSGALAALAAIASFVPYIAVYYVIRAVISVYPEFTRLNIESVLGTFARSNMYTEADMKEPNATPNGKV